MKFTPKTEKEILEDNLWPVGIYNFEVLSAEDKTSKSGNEMIELSLLLFWDERTRLVTDYLLESIAYKLRHAAVACGLESEYENGNLSAIDFVGRTGNLKLRVEKDKNGLYADKNAVQDYIASEISHTADMFEGKAKSSPSRVSAADAFIDDSIPF